MVEDNRVELLRQEVTDGPRFLRRQNRDGSLEPVSVWLEDDGAIYGRVGEKPPQIVDEDWIEGVMAWCKPVSESAYFTALDRLPWPDLPPALEITFSNAPKDPLAVALEELAAEQKALEAWRATNTIHDQVTKDLAGNWIDRIKTLWQRIEDMRKVEKKPHDEAAKAVQEKFKPHLAKAAALEESLATPLRAYLKAEKERAEEARKAALAAGQKATPRYLDRSGKAGTTGRTFSVRKIVSAVIEDRAKALEAMKDSPEILEALQAVCNRVIRAGGTIPGVRREEQ